MAHRSVAGMAMSSGAFGASEVTVLRVGRLVGSIRGRALTGAVRVVAKHCQLSIASSRAGRDRARSMSTPGCTNEQIFSGRLTQASGLGRLSRYGLSEGVTVLR